MAGGFRRPLCPMEEERNMQFACDGRWTGWTAVAVESERELCLGSYAWEKKKKKKKKKRERERGRERVEGRGRECWVRVTGRVRQVRSGLVECRGNVNCCGAPAGRSASCIGTFEGTCPHGGTHDRANTLSP